ISSLRRIPLCRSCAAASSRLELNYVYGARSSRRGYIPESIPFAEVASKHPHRLLQCEIADQIRLWLPERLCEKPCYTLEYVRLRWRTGECGPDFPESGRRTRR